MAGSFKPACVVGELFDEEAVCGPRCTCLEGGEIHCKPRCPQFHIPPDLNCSVVPSPEDPCCSVAECPVELDDSNLSRPLEITEMIKTVHNNESVMNSTHGSSTVPEENKYTSNASAVRYGESNDIPVKTVTKGFIHTTTNDEIIVLNGTEKNHQSNNASTEGGKPSERPQKHFTSLNDLLLKHKQLGSLPLNSTRTAVITSSTATAATTTSKTPFDNNDMNEDKVLVKGNFKTQEVDQDAPHEHNATLMVIVDSKIPEMSSSNPEEESEFTKSIAENEYFEPSNSTTYGIQYSVDERHLQNNDNGSLLINGTISILPNKVDINEVDSLTSETDLPEPFDGKIHFSVSSHVSNRTSISELPESDASDYLSSSQPGDKQNPQSPPTSLPEGQINISELLDAEYEENLHLPLENKDNLDQPEEDSGYLPLNQGEVSYLPASQEEGALTEDNIKHFNQSSHSSRVETSYHVEYSESSPHSGSPSPDIHEVVSHHLVSGEASMHSKKSHLEPSSKNNQQDQNEGILMQLQTVLGFWKWESLNCLC